MKATMEQATLDGVFESSSRRRLLDGGLGRLLDGEKVVDLFCGAGGWGEGLKEAIGVGVDFAVNHSAQAIATHRVNNPACVHHEGDAWKAEPRLVVGGEKVGLLMASAACTTHSRARGAAPISPRVHMLGWCIAKWAKDVAPRVILIENVPEWVDWGPTMLKRDEAGNIVRDGQKRAIRVQNPAKKGLEYRRWWRAMQRLGYVMESRVLDAPDYGAASRRRRLFIIARRDGQPIVWPEKTHGRSNDGEVGNAVRNRAAGATGRGVERSDVDDSRLSGASVADCVVRHATANRRSDSGSGCGCAPYRTAAECIDWSDLGTSIFERPRPLKPKTLARIAEGIRRYVLKDPKPFVLRTTMSNAPGGGWHVASVHDLLRTQTTRQDLAVVTPLVGVCAHGDGKDGTKRWGRGALPVTDPLNAIHAGGNNFGLVSPILAPQNSGVFGQRPDAPGPTITTKGHQAVVAPVLANFRHGGGQHGSAGEPMHCVTSGGNHAGLVAALLLEYYGNTASAGRADKPLGCVTTLDRHGLVVCVIDGTEFVIVDILFRMLRPKELAKAMGFREDFIWPRTQRETVRLIGNAVAPPMAAALVGAVFPGEGRGGER